MTVRPILIAPHPILRQTAQSVDAIDDHIIHLLRDMKYTLAHASGIGLAAPQIGVLQRIIIIHINHENLQTGLLEFINPKIIETSNEQSVYEEGCLSVPGQYINIQRPKSVTITYLDRKEQEKTLHADGLLATCIQHEIDHLNGITLLQHVSRIKRDIMIRKLKHYSTAKP